MVAPELSTDKILHTIYLYLELESNLKIMFKRHLKEMKYLIASLALLVGLSSCNKNDCKEELRPVKHFESEFGCVNTKHDLLVDVTNNVIVIRTKEDYDSKVSGTCHPDIDFSLYDLVIGKQVTTYMNDTIIYDYRIACPENKLTLTFNIVQSDVNVADSVVFHAMIPKLGDEEPLYINVIVK
jgi:hypothetical protein